MMKQTKPKHKEVEITPQSIRSAAVQLGIKEPSWWSSWMKQLRLPLSIVLIALAASCPRSGAQITPREARAFAAAASAHRGDQIIDGLNVDRNGQLHTVVRLHAFNAVHKEIREVDGELLILPARVRTSCGFLLGVADVDIYVPANEQSGTRAYIAHSDRLVSFDCRMGADTAELAIEQIDGRWIMLDAPAINDRQVFNGPGSAPLSRIYAPALILEIDRRKAAARKKQGN